MEDRILRTRLRFRTMLATAEEAADRAAAEDNRGSIVPSSTMFWAMKAMNRAGGFLEAVSIVHPELGAELLGEFEGFAAKVEGLPRATPAGGERRLSSARRSNSDRRSWDRRLDDDRRRHLTEVAAERRLTPERRADLDRRTGKIRELADRRLRSVHR